MILRNSGQVPILTKPITIEQQFLSSAEPSRSRSLRNNAVVRIAAKVTLKHSVPTRVMVASHITGLFYLEPAHLGNQYQRLHIAQGIVETVLSRPFYILFRSLHLKRVKLPKDTVVAHGTEPSLIITVIPQPTQDREPTKQACASSDGPLIAFVHYEMAEDRGVQINQQKAAKSNDQHV